MRIELLYGAAGIMILVPVSTGTVLAPALPLERGFKLTGSPCACSTGARTSRQQARRSRGWNAECGFSAVLAKKLARNNLALTSALFQIGTSGISCARAAASSSE